ncbi:uncharacterized protein [Pseudorasbora parva]|uniref:uncharacterized protein isoform X2 n=1 Tax=Pseudorasbora parva TaxID=51549 RepID=UPI00351E6FC9
MVLKFTSCDVIIVQVVNHQNTDIVQMPGATLRQCPHCRIKMNCRHRSCVKMEKLKALGYVPLLLLGKCSKAHKWTAEVQCPFEFPHEGHQVMEKMLILFEHILKGFGPEKEQEVTEANQLSTWQPKESGKQLQTQIVHSMRLWMYFQWNLYPRHVLERDVKRCWCIGCHVHPGRLGHPPGSLKIMLKLHLLNVNYITATL